MWKLNAFITCYVIAINFLGITIPWYYNVILAMIWLTCLSRSTRNQQKIVTGDPPNLVHRDSHSIPDARNLNDPPNPDARKLGDPPNPDARKVSDPLNPDARKLGDPLNPDARKLGDPPNPDARKLDDPLYPDARKLGDPPNPDARNLVDPPNPEAPNWNAFEIMTAVSTTITVMAIIFTALNPEARTSLTRTDMVGRDVVQLPHSLEEFYYKMNSQGYLTLMLSPNEWPPKMQKLIKYSVPALVYGRPLNKVMVIMIGQSGSGKSTTINTLFADDICSTNSETSQTRDVTEYGKDLSVGSESPAVVAALSFVDLPGALDVDQGKEAPNLASVKKFREESPDLAPRKQIELTNRLGGITIRETVYPNMILMTVTGSDKRMVGPDSNLQKSLKMLDECQMLDKLHINLIIVVTHAMSIPYKKYKEQSVKITSNIRDAVYNVLRIRDVDVVFVENMPEDYDMVKIEGSDFFSLPDGQLSHYNLIKSMVQQFKSNNDFLGRLLCGWYFAESCPEKRNSVNILKSVGLSTLSSDEIKQAQQALFSLGVLAATDHDKLPTLHFHVLGRGYCPRGESLRHISVFRETETKVAQFYGRKYAVPRYIHITEKNETYFHHISSDTKERYENYKKFSYGLDGDIQLDVNVDGRGRWLKDNNVAHSTSSSVSFLYETRLINARMDDIEKQVKGDLIRVIMDLPDWYNTNENREFQAFFSKWGTHFVCEVWIGGSIKIDTSILKSQFSEEEGLEISKQLKTFFSFLADADSRWSASANVRMLNEILTITGGSPPQVLKLKDLTQEKFSDWVQSIKHSPSELLYSVKLYPYYNLVEGRHHDSLRDATLQYLEGGMLPESKLKRENVAKTIVEDVKQEKPTDYESCFPASAIVYTATGFTAISELKPGAKIQTLLYKTRSNDVVVMSEFYTYLHFDPNVTAEFLSMTLDNGNTFSVSKNHLIFTFIDGSVEPVQAKQITVGNLLIFKARLHNTVELVKVVRISTTFITGIYAPLTHEGTLIVDGILVSCYASVDSHVIAHISMTPLRIWYNARYALNNALQSFVSGSYLGLSFDHPQPQPEQGIHFYARLLMFLRNIIFC